MTRHFDFTQQLENFEHEVRNVARYVYAEMAINHAASKSKILLNRLNKTPRFWLTCNAALQSAAYISLGRIFDTKSPYNVNALLNSMEKNIQIFERAELEGRKKDLMVSESSFWNDYLDQAYYPTLNDIKNIRKKVAENKKIYERAIKPVRNKYLAHRDTKNREEVNSLYAAGKVNEILILTTFLLQLNETLWQLLMNGREPEFHPIRHTVESIFDSSIQSGEAHEQIVREVKELMVFMEAASNSLP
jgi:hypothetical protein